MPSASALLPFFFNPSPRLILDHSKLGERRVLTTDHTDFTDKAGEETDLVERRTCHRTTYSFCDLSVEIREIRGNSSEAPSCSQRLIQVRVFSR